jgi:hypothetical protein
MIRLDNTSLLFKFTFASSKDDNHDKTNSSQDTSYATMNAKNLSMA